ncbi:hypothetical protein ABTL25_19550, partial [Acinetobacter baumannii]
DAATLIAYLPRHSLTKDFIKKLRQNFKHTLAPGIFQSQGRTRENPPSRLVYAQLKAPVASKETLDTLLQDPELKDYVVAEADNGSSYLT